MIAQRWRWLGAFATVHVFIAWTATDGVAQTTTTLRRPASVTRHIRVSLHDLAMSPRMVDAHVGDTITWTNRDIVPHTVTSEKSRWDSGLINADARWSHVVVRGDAGTYMCKFHSGMTAILRVTTTARDGV